MNAVIMLWQSRPARERGLILLAAAVVLSAAAFEWLIEPTLKSRASLATRLPQLRAERLALEREHEAVLQQRKAAAARRLPLTESALQASLRAAQLQPESITLGRGGADLTLHTAQPAEALRWAHEASAVFGLNIRHLEIVWRNKERATLRLQLAP